MAFSDMGSDFVGWYFFLLWKLEFHWLMYYMNASSFTKLNLVWHKAMYIKQLVEI